MNTIESKLARAALFATLACGVAASASALPTSAPNHGPAAPGNGSAAPGANPGAAAPAGPAIPVLTMPTPMPAQLPPLDALPPSGNVSQPLPPSKPAETALPEPRTAALLLGGLALMGVASRRRGARRG